MDLYLCMEEFGHFFILIFLKATHINLLPQWHANDLLIHIRATFNLVARISDHEILIIILFFLFFGFNLMQLPTLLICRTINALVLSKMFELLCCGCHIFLSFPPFLLFFPSLEVSYSSFCSDPLDSTLFIPMFSRYCVCT